MLGRRDSSGDVGGRWYGYVKIYVFLGEIVLEGIFHVEAGTVVVNPLYYQEEDNDV